MATHEIHIRIGLTDMHHPDKSTLTLSDNGETTVKPGDTVTWIIDDPSITSILVKDDNKGANVFDPDPAPLSGSTRWSGTVNKNIRKKSTESYLICWSQTGITYCYDPQIKVNP